MVKRRSRYEVWFQYNKTGTYYFRKLANAVEFAQKYRKNKPVIYDLKLDATYKGNW